MLHLMILAARPKLNLLIADAEISVTLGDSFQFQLLVLVGVKWRFIG